MVTETKFSGNTFNGTYVFAPSSVQLPEAAQRLLTMKIVAAQRAQQELNEAIAGMALAVGLSGPVRYNPSTGMLLPVEPSGQQEDNNETSER